MPSILAACWVTRSFTSASRAATGAGWAARSRATSMPSCSICLRLCSSFFSSSSIRSVGDFCASASEGAASRAPKIASHTACARADGRRRAIKGILPVRDACKVQSPSEISYKLSIGRILGPHSIFQFRRGHAFGLAQSAAIVRNGICARSNSMPFHIGHGAANLRLVSSGRFHCPSGTQASTRWRHSKNSASSRRSSRCIPSTGATGIATRCSVPSVRPTRFSDRRLPFAAFRRRVLRPGVQQCPAGTSGGPGPRAEGDASGVGAGAQGLMASTRDWPNRTVVSQDGSRTAAR